MRIDAHTYIGWLLALILFGAVFGVSLVAKEVQESGVVATEEKSHPVQQLERFIEENNPPSPLVRGGVAEVACTMEAKLCPDGSAVGRTGPRCEFAPCPGEGPGILPYDSGVRGRVTTGPQCPVVREGEACPDRPYQTGVDAYRGGFLFVSALTDAEGYFGFSMPPGTYTLRPKGGNPFPACGEEQVTIEPGRMQAITLYCDTGIR
jgi:hypothetical protein